MAGRIRQEDVDAVRDRTDLVKVVSGHLQLKKAGADRYVGLCPFHPEKTPSFSVSPSKQAYYCFGCGEGGGVFRFLEKLENLTFGEAVEKLAAEAGVTLRYEGSFDRRTTGRRQAMHRAIADAAGLYQRLLFDGREATEARAYLGERGISKESVERFGIGYAPTYSDYLLKKLSRTYSPELLVEAGLVSKGESGALRDRFRGRLMFPIHDLSGNAVGFGGRLLAGPRAPQQAAKYVNSPDSSVYHKGTLLYNLNRAKADIIRTTRAFLVEGYTDVIALDQAGVREAVATCGTALGEDHVKRLAVFTEHLVLAFDSDEAGARAAERAFLFHERYPVDLRVLVLPEGQDPADFVLAGGDQAGERFESLLEHAVPLVEYMIKRRMRSRNLDDSEERARAVADGLEIAMQVTDRVRRQDHARVVADFARAPVDQVLFQLEQLQRHELGLPVVGDHVPRRTPTDKVEREALKLLIQAPDLCAAWLPFLSDEQFDKPVHVKVFDLLRDTGFGSGTSLIDRAHERGDLLQKLVAGLSVESIEAGGQATRGYADHVFLRLQEFALARRIEVLRKKLERLNPLNAQDEHFMLFGEMVSLEKERRSIRERAEAVGSST